MAANDQTEHRRKNRPLNVFANMNERKYKWQRYCIKKLQ